MKKKILAVAIMGLFASSAAMAGTIGTVNDGQQSFDNQTTNVQVKNKAKAGKGSLNHASGNIGVNVSAGTGNQQTNATALAVSSNGYVAASVEADQAGAFNFTESIDSKNKASGGKGVLNHAAGNIGVNVAAGNNNQQQNNLAMATRQGDEDSDPTAFVSSQQVSAITGTLTGGDYWYEGSENKATGGKGVLNHAKGNIGMNVAAGTGNQQANSTALANGGGDFVGATIFTSQASIDNMVEDLGILNTATGGEHVLNGAKGNIGVNIAAGEGNQQQNNLALAKSDNGAYFADATVLASQGSVVNGTLRFITENNADAGYDVLNDASGNIGVNIAAGNGNQQANSLALAMQSGNGHDRDPAAFVFNGQFTGGNGSLTLGGDNLASGGDDVLNGASGNIGVNIAAGTGNQQSNAVAIARGNGNYASAGIESSQLSMDNSVTSEGAYNSAFGGYDALNGASGNIGVSIAAGAGNQQQNNLALAQGVAEDEASTAFAGVMANQDASWNSVTDEGVINYAIGGYGTLNGAKGNIGVNIAAGTGNQQANSLSIADARTHEGDDDGYSYWDSAYAMPLQSNQHSTHNFTINYGAYNFATGGFDNLNGATGNIGVNIAAGSGNQQANVTAIAVADATLVKAASGLKQKSKHNETFNGGGETGANLGFGNLNDASGNISVNIAAGTGNQQANSLDIARNASDEDDLKVRAHTGAVQRSAHTTTTNLYHNNEADPGVDNLNGASGNISVNIAAGTGNQQANQLALATGTRSDEEKWGTDAHLKAKVADKQVSRENRVYNQSTSNSAFSGTDNLNDASGNISVNIAAGNGNQQANGVAIAAGDLVHAKATTEATQESLGNSVGLAPEDGYVMDGQSNTNTANGGEGSLNHAHGNISVNVTAGNGNQQKNDLALAAYTGPEADTTALANVVASQFAAGNTADNANLTNTATLGTGMLNHATGNISVNVSAGSFNQQANLLSISNAK
jgi:trimeric autotransporter adhesin